MKILVYGEYYTESFARHISENLNLMGHDVLEYSHSYSHSYGSTRNNLFKNNKFVKGFKKLKEDLNFSVKTFRTSRNKKFLKFITSQNPDLIIVCYDYFWSEEIEQIKKYSKSKIVLWSPDSIATFAAGRSHFMNASYDALFFKDPFIVKNMKSILGLEAYYLPECFNPHQHYLSKDKDLAPYYCDLATAGNLHSYRVAFFKQLISKGYDIKIWGIDSPDWLNKGKINEIYQGKPVYNQDKAAAFLGAKIVINNLLLSEIEGVNVRTFEAAGIGAFQLVDWRLGLEDLFLPGKEIETFKDMNELKEKIDFYLKNETLRNDIADNGKKRAYKDHTYEKRLSLLIDTVFNQSQGFNF